MEDVIHESDCDSANEGDGRDEICGVTQTGEDDHIFGINEDVPLAEVGRESARKRQLAIPATPDYTPLQFDSQRVHEKGKPNGLSFRGNVTRTPISVFLRFIPLNIVDTIVSNTNSYAQLNNAGVGRSWRDVSRDEIKCFFGLTIYMGVFPCPRLEDYWDVSGKSPRHSICKAMGLARFQQIKRFIHICEPSGDNGKSFF